MATFPRGAVERFVMERLGLTKGCKELAKRIIDSYDGDPDDYTALFDHCFALLDEICLAATDAAAALEAEYYQLVREFSTGEAFSPVFESGYTSQSVVESLHAFIYDYSKNKDVNAFSGKMSQRVGMEIDHAIAHCAEENGANDKREKKWARVPGSPTPCTFCCMLASRGFDYDSYETARGEKGSHYGECKCTIMQGYAGMDVEGYDPDAYYRQWKKLEEIDNREDLTQDERDVLKLVAADSEQKFSFEQSKELAERLGDIMATRKDSFLGNLSEENYRNTVESWLEDVGKMYGMDIKGEFLLGEKLYSAIPDGYEIWAATRMRSSWKEIRFLGTDRRRKKGNPDLLVNGEYVDIKTPESDGRIARRVNQGATQCRNRGQDEGIVLLSPLRLDGGYDRMDQISQERIDQGFADRVYVIESDLNITQLDKTSG